MRILGWIGIVSATLLGCLTLVWLGQRRLIYFPPDGRVASASTVLPGAEDVTLTTEDGLALGAWFIPAVRRADESPPGRSPAVLVLNGNAGSRHVRAPLADALTRHGLAVLLFDYRGYAGNPGRPDEEGLIRDARAARAHLVSRDDVDHGRIIYFGESLGAAVAVALAAEQPPAALVLRSPFTSLAAVGQVHYPWLPVRLLLADRYPSIERITRISCPLLVIAGGRDAVVPHAQSRELFDAAVHPEKEFIAYPRAGHNDPVLTAGPALARQVARFVTETTAAAPGPAD